MQSHIHVASLCRCSQVCAYHLRSDYVVSSIKAKGRSIPKPADIPSALYYLNGIDAKEFYLRPPILPQYDIEACADFWESQQVWSFLGQTKAEGRTFVTGESLSSVPDHLCGM